MWIHIFTELIYLYRFLMNSLIKWILLCMLFWLMFHNYCYYIGTNKQKKELFVMAIRTPTGRTFPGNFTIIPSAKKWVFHTFYRLAFLSLYGELICSFNWLVLTDKEDAEYRSFENLIVTHEMFRSSKVMLCTFHAIWQPFKRDIYNLLPSKKKEWKIGGINWGW